METMSLRLLSHFACGVYLSSWPAGKQVSSYIVSFSAGQVLVFTLVCGTVPPESQEMSADLIRKPLIAPLTPLANGGGSGGGGSELF